MQISAKPDEGIAAAECTPSHRLLATDNRRWQIGVDNDRVHSIRCLRVTSDTPEVYAVFVF
jgi:cobalamin biosynthesis protein CobT